MKAGCPIKAIIKRNGTIVRYDRERIATALLKATASMGRADRGLAASVAAKVEAALISTYGSSSIPSVEEIQDVVERVLMENRLTQIARNYIIYRHQRAMARAARAYEFEVTDCVPYKKIYEVLRWNMDHQCESVPSLNRLIAEGRLPDLIRDSDRRYDEEIELAVSRILASRDRVRLVIVAGPSSSGKTTTIHKIAEQLRAHSVPFQTLNLDNYFFDLANHPRDEFGDYDYETPKALDLDLINRHLVRLLDGEPVRTPHYDFKKGTRRLDAHPLRLKKNELLLLDSLHGLFEEMTHGVPAEHRFAVYIETLGQFRADDGTFMRWSDHRLLRRMIRDRDFRNLKPMETLTHWHYVRRSELKFIIPFIRRANCIVNSALPYEMPFLRHKLFPYVARARNAYRDDPKRLDAHIRANRVYALLKPVRPVRDDRLVPHDSLFREFIGGSRYAY